MNDKNLTYQERAEKMGVSAGVLWRYEKKGIEPIDPIIRARLGVDTEEPRFIYCKCGCGKVILQHTKRRKFFDHKCRARYRRSK